MAKIFTEKGFLVAFPQWRGRGKSDGLYDECLETSRSRYSCDPQLSLPGLERALANLDAVSGYLAGRQDVDSERMLVGGVSRGGIASAVYAAKRPTRFAGVVNFVSGWAGDRCANAEAVNTASFKRAAGFSQPMLWLSGKSDPFSSASHSQKSFDALIAARVKGIFKVITPSDAQTGHGIHAIPNLWRDTMNDYLTQIRLQ